MEAKEEGEGGTREAWGAKKGKEDKGMAVETKTTEAKKTTAKHWSTTAEGGLVARATAYTYRHIVAGTEEGGLKEVRAPFLRPPVSFLVGRHAYRACRNVFVRRGSI